MIAAGCEYQYLAPDFAAQPPFVASLNAGVHETDADKTEIFSHVNSHAPNENTEAPNPDEAATPTPEPETAPSAEPETVPEALAEIKITAVTLSVSVLSMDKGDSHTLTYITHPENASDIEEMNPAWHSSDPAVARVVNGHITALGEGTAVITLTVFNCEPEQCVVTVVIPVIKIEVTTDRSRYDAKETVRFAVNVYPEDATDKSYNIDISGINATLAGANSIAFRGAGAVKITAAAPNGVVGEKIINVVDLDEFAAEVLILTNAERTANGLGELTGDEALDEAAFTRAHELIRSFSHTRPDGREWWTINDEHGIVYRAAAENVAMGQNTPQQVVADWMSSPKHRINILNGQLGRMGVGVAMDSSGRLYWSQNFTD